MDDAPGLVRVMDKASGKVELRAGPAAIKEIILGHADQVRQGAGMNVCANQGFPELWEHGRCGLEMGWAGCKARSFSGNSQMLQTSLHGL